MTIPAEIFKALIIYWLRSRITFLFALLNYTTDSDHDVCSYIGHSNRLSRDPNLEIALLLSSPKYDDTR